MVPEVHETLANLCYCPSLLKISLEMKSWVELLHFDDGVFSSIHLV